MTRRVSVERVRRAGGRRRREASRTRSEKLRDLVTDLQLVQGARGVVSIYSARCRAKTAPPPLFPEPLPQGPISTSLSSAVKANEIIQGKLLSLDGQLTLVVLSLEPDATAQDRLGGVIAEIRKTMAEDLAGVDLKAELSGVPVMQLEIRNAVRARPHHVQRLRLPRGCLIAIPSSGACRLHDRRRPPPLAPSCLRSARSAGWISGSTCS